MRDLEYFLIKTKGKELIFIDEHELAEIEETNNPEGLGGNENFT
jgi:hypothetical protein